MSSTATTVRPTDRVHPPIFEALTVVGLIGIAWVHILDLSGKMEETPYLGFAYIGLIAGCAAAVVLLARRDRRGFLLAGGLAAATFLGYCLSRTTGLPAATTDVGNWAESLGIWSLVLEGAVVALSVAALSGPARQSHPESGS
jgi:apolipoprotein N-acyltransferase